MRTLAEQYPESRGAGAYGPSGSVTYGDLAVPRVHIEPPTAREPGQPANVVADGGQGCPRCHDIPPDVLAALQRALSRPGARR